MLTETSRRTAAALETEQRPDRASHFIHLQIERNHKDCAKKAKSSFHPKICFAKKP